MKRRTIIPGPGVPLPPFTPSPPHAHAHDAPARTHTHEDTPPDTGTPATPGPALPQGSASAERDLISLDPTLIDQNPFAPREIYTPEMVLQRAEDLRRYGQNDPIHVIPHPEHPGRYIIADGWTRVRACIEHKALPTLWAYVHHGLSIKEAAWLGYTQNESRKQHSDYDRGMFYAKMIEDGTPVNEVARMAGITPAYLRMYRAFARLPAEVVDIIRLHPDRFGPFAANELLKVCEAAGLRKGLALAMQFAEEDRSVRWLAAQVQATIGPKGPRGPALVRQIRFGNGYFRQKGNKVELALEVPKDRLKDFTEELEELLKEVAEPLREDDDPGTPKTPDTAGAPGGE